MTVVSGQPEDQHDYGMAKGHAPVAEKVICIDFDGTLVPWGPLMGERQTFPGAVDLARRFKRAGWRIVIFTSRLSRTWAKSVVGANGWEQSRFLDEQHDYIAKVLTDNGVPFDLITAEKVPAQHYVDDKAWRVNGHMPVHAVLNAIAEGEGLPA